MSTKKSDAGQSTQVRISIANISSELLFETSASVNDVKIAVTKALSENTPLILQDSRGHEVIISSDKIGFVDVGLAADRRVGFGAL
jgi:hypothetical protein